MKPSNTKSDVVKSKLDLLEQYVVEGITYAVVEKTEDLYHEDDDTVVRAFFFNKGMREQIVVLGADGYIYSNTIMTERAVSKNLIDDLIPVLFDFLAACEASEQS